MITALQPKIERNDYNKKIKLTVKELPVVYDKFVGRYVCSYVMFVDKMYNKISKALMAIKVEKKYLIL